MEVLLGQGTGLNTDDDPRFMLPGDGERWNMIPVAKGKDGLLVSIDGNGVITGQSGYEGTVRGAVYDVKSRGIIYFVDGTSDMIIRYNLSDETFDEVLDLGADHFTGGRIDARVVDQILIWTDVKPYSINIEEAIKFTVNPATSVYSTIGDEELSFIRYTPAITPTAEYKSDNTYTHNFLRSKQFQFVYKYEYYDHSHSVWSPVSAVPVGEPDEDLDGNFVTDDYVNNIIEVGLPEPSDIVIKIHLAVREGNESLFRLVEVLEVSELTFVTGFATYEFKDDIKGGIISDEEIFRLYDDVPLEAGYVEVIDKNMVAFGKIKKGYDPITPSVSLSYDVKAVAIATVTNDLQAVLEKASHHSVDPNESFIRFKFPDVDYHNVTVSVGYLQFAEEHPNYRTRERVFDKDVDGDGMTVSVADVLSYFSSLPVFSIPGTTIYFPFDTVTIDGSDWLNFPRSGYANSFLVTIPPNTGRRVDFARHAVVNITPPYSVAAEFKNQSFKFGHEHSFALGYKDEEGRLMHILHNNDMKISIPFLKPVNIGRRTEVSWAITHNAPAGAKYYQWFYAKNTPDFLQVVLDIDYHIAHSDSLGYILDINGAIQRYYAEGVKMPYYDYREGDRVRVIAYGADRTAITVSPAIYDIPIKAPFTAIEEDAVTATGSSIARRTSDAKIMSGVVVPDNDFNFNDHKLVFIEVYSPRRTETSVFHEFSPVYEVEVDHHLATGTFGTEDAGNYYGGDVYVRLVVPFFFGESSSYSYYYDSNSVDIGRPVFYDPNQREVELQDVIHGRRYFEDTQINGLFSFYSSDRPASLSSSFGEITGMVLRGDTLRVYQEKKNTSIYIGSVIITRPDGSEELVASDRVLGTIVPSRDSYGTQHPDSVCKVGRTIYFYDQYNGEFLRDAVNGVFPVSGRVTVNEYNFDYKMRSYFKDLDATNVKCGYDAAKELLFVHVVGSVNETLAFHEPSNRWVSFFNNNDGSFDIDLMIGAEKEFFSWGGSSGLMYAHNDITSTQFYGVDFTPSVTFYANEGANIKKFLKSLSLHTNQATRVDIDVPGIEIYSPGDAVKVRDQESWLLADWFALKRGIYHASFKRNAITSSDTPSVLDLHNGEKLRGYYAKIKLTGSVPLEIFKVDILFGT